jgi:hypothetical protein
MDFSDVSTYIVNNNILYGEMFRQCDRKRILRVTDHPYLMEESSNIWLPLVSKFNASSDSKTLRLARTVYFVFRMDLKINSHCNPSGFRGFPVTIEANFGRLEV